MIRQRGYTATVVKTKGHVNGFKQRSNPGYCQENSVQIKPMKPESENNPTRESTATADVSHDSSEPGD